MIENTYRINREIQSEVLPTSEEFVTELKKYGIEPEMPQAPKPGELQPAQPSGKPDMQSDVSGLAKGAAKTAENIANVIPDIANAFQSGAQALDEWMLKTGITKDHLVNPKAAKFQRYDWDVKPTKEQEFSFLLGSFASQLATFGLTAAKTGSLVGGAAAGGATSFAVQDPQAPRFSDYLKDTPIVGPMADFLSSSPDDSEAESRFKNAIESMGIDTALGLAVSKIAGGYRTWKSSVAALEDTAKAAPTGAQPAIKETTAVGQPKTFVAAKMEQVPEPSIKEPVRNVFEGMTPQQINEDIQTALREFDPEKEGINFQPYIRADVPSTGLAMAVEKKAGALGRPASKTDPEVFAKAAEIVGNTEKITELLNRPMGSAFTDIEVTALNMEMTSAGNEATKILDNIKELESVGADIPEATLVALDQQLSYFTNTFAKFNQSTSAAGSSLRMANYAFDAKGQSKALGQYLELVGGKESLRERAALLNDILEKDPDGLIKAADLVGKTNATWGEALLEMRIQNMLSPVTAVKVAVSNMAQHLTETLSRSMAVRIAEKAGDTVMADIMKQAANAQQNTLYNSLGAELISGVKTFMEDVSEHGWRALKPSEMTKNNRYAYRTVPAMSSKALNIQNRIGATMVDAYGEASKLGAVPLQLVDIYSDAIARRTEGSYRATLAGLEKGLSGDELISFVDDVTKERPIKPLPPKNPTPEAARNFANEMAKYEEYSQIWKSVDEYANHVKFQGTPTTGIGGKFYEMAVSSDFSFAGVPLLRAASPFIRNKVNMAQAAFDVLPGTRGWSVRNQEILRAGGVDAYLLKARFQIANTVLMAGAVGGLTGLMYGKGAINPDVARVQRERGYNPYSFMNTANFDVAGTPGIVGAIATDVGFLARYYMSGAVDEKWNTDFTDALTYITASIADKLAPEDMIIDMWHGMSNLQENPSRAIKAQLIREGVTTLTPSAATFNAARKLTDPTKRQTKSDALGIIQNIIMDLANRIPYVNKALEPALDTLGYPITEKYGVVRLATDFDPEFIEKNKVLKGLIDLGMAGALVTPHPEGASKDEMVIRPMAKTLKLKGTAETIPLTPKQYNDLVLMSLLKDNPDKPGEVEKKLSDILSSEKSDALKKLQILKIVSEYREAAKAKVVSNYPELKGKWKELVKQRAQAYREEGVATVFPGVSVDDSQGPLGADFMED